MTRISDLSEDLIEEILSRVPLTSQPAVRSTCKQWNGLYKNERFRKKHLSKAAYDNMVIMVCDSRVCLLRVDLHGVHTQKRGLVELSTKPIGQLNHIPVSRFDHVYHCDGLLLCLPKNSIPVVWNPYLGQVRWIKPRKKLYIGWRYKYCLGYDNNNNHKILRFLNHYPTDEYDLYDFNSDSWRVLDPPDTWTIRDYSEGFSLKGNTYFVAQERLRARGSLICFDFTSEIFKHCLDLEYNCYDGDSVILSSVREEQLAVLFHRVVTYEIEIRITTKIEEANEMTWTSSLKIDVKPFGLSGRYLKFLQDGSNFFVDENKKVALICDKHFSKAYVIGEDSYFKFALVKSTSGPVVCSYVPSSVQIPKGPVDAYEA